MSFVLAFAMCAAVVRPALYLPEKVFAVPGRETSIYYRIHLGIDPMAEYPDNNALHQTRGGGRKVADALAAWLVHVFGQAAGCSRGEG